MLFRSEELNDVEKKAPLAVYAAEYWVHHAQFEDVASRIKGMEDLFDPNKPYFAAWRGLYDIELPPSGSAFGHFGNLSSGLRTPLYYAAFCGFANIVEQLIAKHPQDVHTRCGRYKTPAVAALAGRHFQLAQVLHRSQSSLEPRGCCDVTPLHSAAYHGDLETVQVLLECGVDVNAKNTLGYTPLDFALSGGHNNEVRVALLSIAQGADPNTRNVKGCMSLRRASESGRMKIVCLLIEHGANVDVKDDTNERPYDAEVASGKQLNETIKLLLEQLH